MINHFFNKSLKGQSVRYYRGACWLISELWKCSPRDMLLLTLASGLGVLLSGASFAAILQFFNLIESNGEIPGLGSGEDILASGFFYYLLGLSLTFLVSGFYLIYWSKKISIALGASFHVHCAGKILTSFGGKIDTPLAYLDEKNLYSEINKLQNSDARQCGIAVRRMLQSVVAVFVVPAGFAVMAWLSWLSALFIVFLILLAGPIYYIINLGAARATKDFEVLNGLARRSGLDMLNKGNQIEEVNVRKGGSVIILHDKTGGFIKAADAFRRRFKALAEAEFVSQCIMAVGVVALLSHMGYLAFNNEVSWTFILAFLLVFRFTMAAFRQLFQTMATYSRLFPSIYRVGEFLCFGKFGGESCANLPESFHIKVMKGGMYEKRRAFSIKVGDVVGITSSVPVNRYTLRLYARVLIGRNDAEIDRALPKVLIINDLGRVLSAEKCVENLQSDDEISTDSIVFVEARTLKGIPGLWERLKSKNFRYLVVCDRTGKGVRNRKVDVHLISTDDGLLAAAGSMDFIEAHYEEIGKVVESRRGHLAKRNTGFHQEVEEDI